jgi:hypothetical protein
MFRTRKSLHMLGILCGVYFLVVAGRIRLVVSRRRMRTTSSAAPVRASTRAQTPRLDSYAGCQSLDQHTLPRASERGGRCNAVDSVRGGARYLSQHTVALLLPRSAVSTTVTLAFHNRDLYIGSVSRAVYTL